MSPSTVLVSGLLRLDPPLVPSPDDAHEQLRRELLRPEYHQQSLLQRAVDWLGRRVDGLIDTTSQAPTVSTAVAMVVLVVLVLALVWLVSRVRRQARAKDDARAVLTDEVVTARELRERADRAYDDGRWEDVVVDGFRAVTLRQIETGRISDTPGATAHEVSVALGVEHPDHRTSVDAVSLLFDRVLYGEHRTDLAGARSVLDLDDVLAGRRGARR